MKTIMILAGKEIRDGLRNRWLAASVLLLAALALSLAFLGTAPAGAVKASMLSATVASLTSLTVYLLPLVALMLSFDALVGEFERGTMLLLLTYPVARWQVVLGKFIAHLFILIVALTLGYGSSGLLIAVMGGGDAEGWRAFAVLIGSSVLLGAVFVALGYLISIAVAERATAAGLAIALWLLLVVVYDLLLLGLLLADSGQSIGEASFSALLLFNPTDSYRLVNLTAFEGVRQAAGLAGVGLKAGADTASSLAIMVIWAVLPLSATVFLFQRREL
jgi:Cu-processing system permease protein